MSNKSGSSYEFFSKIDVSEVFSSHLKTMKNYRHNSYSYADILIFFVFPFILSSVAVFANFKLNTDLIGILINVFAIFCF